MELTQHFFAIRVVGLETFVYARSVRNSALADAAALDEDLRLQKLLALARFALHVIDRVFVPNVGVESENHASQALPGPVDMLSSEVPPDETRVKLRG